MRYNSLYPLLLLSLLVAISCNKTRQNSSRANQYTPSHTSQNSLDWSGTYTGTLPCASCSAIKMTLTLNEDGTYEQTSVYEGKNDSDAIIVSGTFGWNDTGNKIMLENEEKPNQYFVGENYLRKLDMDGNRITGDLAGFYILKKE